VIALGGEVLAFVLLRVVAVIGARLGTGPGVPGGVLLPGVDVVVAGVAARVMFVGKAFVRGFVDGILGVGHAVPTHTDARRLSVEPSRDLM
jgi:hypothetical protein